MMLSEECRALAMAASDAAAAVWFGMYVPFALAGSRISEYFSKRRRGKACGMCGQGMCTRILSTAARDALQAI